MNLGIPKRLHQVDSSLQYEADAKNTEATKSDPALVIAASSPYQPACEIQREPSQEIQR